MIAAIVNRARRRLTGAGGTSDRGTVFQMAPDGSGYAVLHSFTGGGTDGALPTAGLIQGADGTFYGTTYLGGTSNLGVVFQLTLPSSAPTSTPRMVQQ